MRPISGLFSYFFLISGESGIREILANARAIRRIFLVVFGPLEVCHVSFSTLFPSFLSNRFSILPLSAVSNYFQFSKVTTPERKKCVILVRFLFYGDRLKSNNERGTYQRSLCFGHANAYFAQIKFEKFSKHNKLVSTYRYPEHRSLYEEQKTVVE